jgi:hypothetical protein
VANNLCDGFYEAARFGQTEVFARVGNLEGRARVVVERREEEPPAIASIQVTPGSFHFLQPGVEEAFTATAFDADGQTIEGVAFNWRSSRPLVASVTQEGLVTANRDGEAGIFAEADGIEGAAEVRVTRSPEESLELAFLRWWQVTGNPDGPAPFLSTAAFQHSAWALNFGMVEYSGIPRRPILNDSTATYYPNFRNAWRWSYEALDHTARALLVLDEGFYPDVDGVPVLAFARFLQGVSHGALALLFDQAAVMDETVFGGIEDEVYWATHAPHLLPLVGYGSVMDAALDYLTESIAISESAQFQLPQAWLPATTLITGGDLSRIARSYRARFRSNLARGPDEAAAVDWVAVLNDVESGVQEDLLYQFDGSMFVHESFEFTHREPWSQMNNFVHGMADQTEGYREWMSTPVEDRGPFLIITPDLRFPQGETAEAQRGQAGTHFFHPDAYSHAQPERGTWRWSLYVSARTPEAGITGQVEDLSMDEMNLLAAEAHYRLGNLDAAVDLINRSRSRNRAGLSPTDVEGTNPDCVPLLPNGQCGDLFEMLKWEKRLMGVHNAGNLMAPWYFDGRRWGDLLIGTFLHFPVPEQVLAQRGMAVYSFGGEGQPGSAGPSMFDPPQ